MDNALSAANEPFTKHLMERLAGLDARLARIEVVLLRPANEPQTQPLLFTIPEAAKVIGIGVDTLRAWVASGRLPHRTKGATLNPKRPTYVVNIDEVRAAAAGKGKR